MYFWLVKAPLNMGLYFFKMLIYKSHYKRLQFTFLILKKMAMLINIEKLKETPIVQKCYSWNMVEDYPMLEKLYQKKYVELNHNDLNLPYNYFIFIDLPEPIVILHTQGVELLEQRTNQHYSFKDAVLGLPEVNYASLLFLSTLYQIITDTNPIQLIDEGKKFEPVFGMEDLFQDTYGYLIYSPQTQALICRNSYHSFKDAYFMIRGWNAKKSNKIEEIRKIQIESDVMLSEFIKQRSVSENLFLLNPNYVGAQKLWNYLITNSI